MLNRTGLYYLAVTCFAMTLAAEQPRGPSRYDSSVDAFVSRMMAYDANHDGRLTRSEITDDRLLELFDRADTNHDGVVTRAELKALYAAESSRFIDDRGPEPGGRGPGPGRGGPPRDDHGDRGRGGPPPMRQQPGQVLSESAQRMLNLTPDQQAGLAEIQRDVDARLDRLLTADQKAQLKRMDDRGPYR
jgi:EF hand